MTAAATSPQQTSLSGGAWGQFLAFVRRPVLPDRASGVSGYALGVIAKLLALDLLVMMAFLAIVALAARFGLTPPRSLLEGVKLSPLLGFIAIGAPIAEELIFRSWQSGRPGHIGALLIALVTGALAVFLMIGSGASAPRVIAGLVLAVAGFALALWWLWSGRAKPVMAWFQRHYPWFYFAATFLFAAAHMTNFAGRLSWLMLPLTFPQFSIGLMLGHVRVRFGLWASVLLHAAHNSLFIALALLGNG